ncbi:hypothetical protein ABH940_002283 [Streptacidiphilus sp. BW17]|uniref:DUF5677 domain-containing protein n=1 Tax=Streptacidiphilus sp. BW17 TaxID=3156274 RepID=UPI0035197FDC
MAEPDYAQGLERLHALISGDLHEHIDPLSRPAIVGWGWFFQIVHQLYAVQRGHQDGHCGSGAPNRRSAFEHALSLFWLVDLGDDAVDILNRALQEDQKQLANLVKAAGLEQKVSEEAYQVLWGTIAESIPSHPEEGTRKISQLLKKYDLKELATYYCVESRFAHPTLSSAQMFFADRGETYELHQLPRFEEAIPCHQFCVQILFDSMHAFNRLMLGQPWSAALQEIAEEYGLTLPIYGDAQTPDA